MNDLKATCVLQNLYKNSTREGQVSLVSTHDVTNPPVHYCNWSLAYFGSKVLTMKIIIKILIIIIKILIIIEILIELEMYKD